MESDSIRKIMMENRSIAPVLTSKKKQLLHFFAVEGDANTYIISKKCKMRYSTAHTIVKALEKEGFIQLQAEETNEKGVTAKTYGLTDKGLYMFLFLTQNQQKRLEALEKWQSLLTADVAEWLKFLEEIGDPEVESYLNQTYEMFSSGSKEILPDAKFRAFFRFVPPSVIMFAMERGENRVKIMRGFRGYPRLKAKFLEFLESYIASMEKDLKEGRLLKAKIESLPCT